MCLTPVSLGFAAPLWGKVAEPLRDLVCVAPCSSTRWKCVLHNPDSLLAGPAGWEWVFGGVELLSLERCSEAPSEFKECSFCQSPDGHFWVEAQRVFGSPTSALTLLLVGKTA